METPIRPKYVPYSYVEPFGICARIQLFERNLVKAAHRSRRRRRPRLLPAEFGCQVLQSDEKRPVEGALLHIWVRVCSKRPTSKDSMKLHSINMDPKEVTSSPGAFAPSSPHAKDSGSTWSP